MYHLVTLRKYDLAGKLIDMNYGVYHNNTPVTRKSLRLSRAKGRLMCKLLNGEI